MNIQNENYLNFDFSLKCQGFVWEDRVRTVRSTGVRSEGERRKYGLKLEYCRDHKLCF